MNYRSPSALAILTVLTVAAVVLFPSATSSAQSEPEMATTIDIPNARWVENRLLLGGQPTEAQLTQAAELGFKQIINMRGVGEEGSMANEAELVAELGMSYSAIPIASGEDFSLENATLLAELLRSDEKAIIHCASGNRVGILFALKGYKLDGMDRDAAIKLGERYGMRSLPAVVNAALAEKP